MTKKEIAGICNTIGVGLFIMAIINMGSQYILIDLLNEYFPKMNNILKIIITNSIGFYFIGLIVFKLVTKKIPIIKPLKTRLYETLDIIELSLLSIGAMYIFNFLGLIITLLLGIESLNPVDMLITGVGTENIMFLFIATCILAPIFEELLFRGWILGKLKAIGSNLAIFVSATLFAFYHMNIVQGIYAFGIGLILGYVTIRSGSIKVAIILHGIVNFVGGIIMPMLIGVFPGISIVHGETIVTALVLWFLLCGGMIFLRKRKYLLFSEQLNEDFQVEATFSTVNINIGMILFYVYCILMTIKHLTMS